MNVLLPLTLPVLDSKEDIKLIFMEADVDDSGSLEYEEFIPLMMHVIDSIKEVEHAREEEEIVREHAEQIAEEVRGGRGEGGGGEGESRAKVAREG